MSQQYQVLPPGHPQFGQLVFKQNYPVMPGIVAIIFGVVMLLIGVVCIPSPRAKMMIGGVCGLGVGAFMIGFGIYFLATKVGTTWHFFQQGFVYRGKSGINEIAYRDVKNYSVAQHESGGRMPGVHFKMIFRMLGGQTIEYTLGVDHGDNQRFRQAQELIQLIRSEMNRVIIPQATAKEAPLPLDDGPIPLEDAPPRVAAARPAPPARPSGVKPPPPPPPRRG